jgi:dynactin-5
MTDSTADRADTSAAASPAAAVVVPDDDATNTPTTSPTKDTDTAASSYIQTSTGNWVSRRAVIEHARHVELKGRSVVHADSKFKAADAPTGWIRAGRYVHVGAGTTIQPALLPAHHQQSRRQQRTNDTDAADTADQNVYVPVTIGSHTIIRKNCYLQAAAVGSYCWIGRSVVLGPRVIIKDCCVIADNVTIPADTIIPPFTRVTVEAIAAASSPSSPSSDKQPSSRLVCRELPPSTAQELQEQSMELYQNFVVLQQQRKLVNP